MALARIIRPGKLLVERAAPRLVAAWQRRRLARALAARRKPLPAAAARLSRRPAVLFFAPDALVTPHFVTHLVVARTLKELGHDVLILRCFGHLQPRCMAMQAMALPVAASAGDRARICESCVRQSLSMVDGYGLDTVDLEQVVDEAMRAEVRLAMASAPEDLQAFVFDGVPVGKFANGDLSRLLKLNDPAAAGGEPREHMRQYIETAVLSYLAVRRLCEHLNVARLVYFNDYAMTLAASAAAEQKGIATTHLSHAPILNNDRRRITMLSGYAPLEGQRRLRSWPQWRDLALPRERVALISEDSFLRFAGSGFTIYSPAWTKESAGLFERLRLDRARRLLVAYTSSEDEVRGVRYYESALGVEIYPGSSPFADQFDWVQSLVGHVESSSDLQLVIRIHPREAANQREKRTSENLAEYQRRFSSPYRHVRVVWPADPVSSYDLAEIADVGLIALSTIGFELARLGVPVIAAMQHLAEAPEEVFVRWDNSRDGYFAALRRALDEPPSFARIVAAFRWVNARFLEYAVDLGDVVPTRDFPGLPPCTMPREARVIEQVLVGGRLLSDINRERLEQAQRRDSAVGEGEEIALHLRHFLYFLMFGRRPPADYALRDPTGAEERSSTRRHTEDRYAAVVANGIVALSGREGTATKFSPMAARMALLALRTDAAAEAEA